ncbi:MAG: serine/threonine-protein kinase [Planctomycetota bacterium]
MGDVGRSATHERFKELLLRLQGLGPRERAQILDTEVGDDPALRARLDRLLRAGDEAQTDFLDPLVEVPRTDEDAVDPTQVGPYRIEGLLGRGGMACVYRATQEHPFRRSVALKLIRPGLDSDEILARFESERRVLAHLEHRHIARVLDAGADPYGPSYFVMELVDGPRITEYADQNELDVPARLALFVQLCRGMQHAHARGVLHRDLKPSNILVGTEDCEPVVKIIDFGVAKALGASSPLAEERHTTAQQLVGTLEYMSPEQAEFHNPDIDVRSDVYALGVVLYELLTGSTPIPRAAFEGKSVAEIQTLIHESRSTRPSERSESPRELDCVVLKALEKAPRDRYETVKDLADEVERYLAGRPLEAKEPTPLYLLQKYAARHRGRVAAVGAVALAIVLGLIGTTYGLLQSIQRQHELEAALRREAEGERTMRQVVQFQKKNLAGLDLVAMGATIRKALAIEEGRVGEKINFTDVARTSVERDILQRALAAVDTQFPESTIVRADLLQGLADILVELGLTGRAEGPQDEALAIRREKLGDAHPDTFASIASTASLQMQLGHLDRARALAEEALTAPAPEVAIGVRTTLAVVESRSGRAAESIAAYERLVPDAARMLGRDHPKTLLARLNYSTALHRQGKLELAEREARAVMEGRLRVFGESHVRTQTARANYAALLSKRGLFAEAEPLMQETATQLQRLLGSDHPKTLRTKFNLATILFTAGQTEAALELGQEVLDARRATIEDDHRDTLRSFASVGQILDAMHRDEEAWQHGMRAYEGRRRLFGPAHRDTLHSLNFIGVLSRKLGRYEEAERYLREASTTRTKTLGAAHPRTLISDISLASVLRLRGAVGDAEALARDVVARARKALPTSHWYIAVFEAEWGRTLVAAHRLEEAKPILERSHAMLKRKLGAGHARTRKVAADLEALRAKLGTESRHVRR